MFRLRAVVVLTLTRMIKSVVTGQAQVTLELGNTPGKNTNKPKVVHAYTTADANLCLHQKHIRVKSGVSLRCARPILVHVSLLAPGKNDYTACHPRKTTAYIFHVVPITTHTRDRRKSIGKKKQRKEKKMKERKGKKRQESEKKKKERKEKTRKARKDKTRGSKKRKREKNVILADPRN